MNVNDISEILKLEKEIKNSENKNKKDDFIKSLNGFNLNMKKKYYKNIFNKVKNDINKLDDKLYYLNNLLNEIIEFNNDKTNNNSSIRIINEIKIDIYKLLIEQFKEYNYDDDYYPETNYELFNEKICNKKEFNQNKYPKFKDIEKKTNKNFEKTNIQKFVKNFISTHTIFNSLFLWHGVGAGKTCAAIGIAENFRDFVLLNGKKILIIGAETLKGNWINEIFNIEKIDFDDEFHMQCTSKTSPYNLNKNPNIKGQFSINRIYKLNDIVYFKGNTYKYILDKSGNKSLPDINNPGVWKKTFDLKKITDIIKTYYEFYGTIKLINVIKREFFYKKNNNFGYDLIKYIKKKFSNRVIIIDEVHNTRRSDESGSINDEEKISSTYLELIARYAENTKLIILTATPMYNKSTEIIWLLNLLLLNDKKAPLDKDLFFDRNDNLINKKLLIEKSRGYISYIKGSDPNIFPQIIYPNNYFIKNKNTITGKPYKSEIILYESKSNEKIDNFLKKIKTKNISNINERQASNILLPDNNNNLQIVPKKKNKLRKLFENMSTSELINFSPKFYNILQSIMSCKGKVFIYSEFISSGILSFCMALERFGFTNYHGDFLETKPKDYFCSKNLKQKSKILDNSFNQAQYLYIDGDTNKDDMNKYISIFNNIDNISGDQIKIIIASRVIEVGVNLKSIREVHVMDPWFNFSKIKQIIGRTTRNYSHHDLKKNERNVTVFLHVLDSKYSKDKYIYNTSFNKHKKISIVERELKKNAIDCCINKYVNQFTEENYPNLLDKTIVNSKNKVIKLNFTDKDNSIECDFMKCDYKCNGEIKKINNKTYNYSFSRDNINKIKIIIKNMFKDNYVLEEKQILKEIKKQTHGSDDKYIYISLDEIVKNNEITYDYFGKKGFIINRKNYYIFQPSIFENRSIPLLYRYLPNESLIKSFNLNWNINNDDINYQKYEKGTISLDLINEYKHKIEILLNYTSFNNITKKFRNKLYDALDPRPSIKEINKYFCFIFIQKIPTLLKIREQLLVNSVERLINKKNDKIDDLIISYYNTENIFTCILRKSDLYPHKFKELNIILKKYDNKNFKKIVLSNSTEFLKLKKQIQSYNSIYGVRFYDSNNIYCRKTIQDINPGTNIWFYNDSLKKMQLDLDNEFLKLKFNLSIYNNHIDNLINTQIKGPPPQFKNLNLNLIYGYYCNSSKGFNLKPNSNSLRIVNNLSYNTLKKQITSKFDKKGNRILSKKTQLKGAECGSGTKANTVKDLLKILQNLANIDNIDIFKKMNISLGKENTNKLKSWMGEFGSNNLPDFSDALDGCLCTDIEILLTHLDYIEMQKSKQFIMTKDIFSIKDIDDSNFPKHINLPISGIVNEFTINSKFKRYVFKIEETYMCSDVREPKPIKRKRGRQRKNIVVMNK
jgi:hypothetical protein